MWVEIDTGIEQRPRQPLDSAMTMTLCQDMGMVLCMKRCVMGGHVIIPRERKAERISGQSANGNARNPMGC